MISNTFKKYIYTLAIFSAITLNVTYAESDTSKEGSTFNFKIIKQFFDIFNTKETKNESTSTIMSATSSNVNENQIFESVLASSTASTCDSQIKINQKKDKISKKIKSQLQDKNKLIENLLQISSSTEGDDNHKNIDETILKLDEMVSDIVHDQKSLLAELASSTDNYCDTKSKKETKESKSNTQKIKKLEQDINKKSNEINTFIKVDIKNILEEFAN